MLASTQLSPKPEAGFDHIVIGTGSAGSAVVNRLAGTGASILVMEAGACR